MIRKQLELINLTCPCARSYATYLRTASRETRSANDKVLQRTSRPKDDFLDEGPSSSRGDHNRIAPTFSRQFRGRVDIPVNDDQARPPRYLRRATSHSSPASAPSRTLGTISRESKAAPSSINPPKGTAYRSRNFDPSKVQDSKSEIRLLEPHVLSVRLRKLCDGNQVDAAVSMLKNSPLDAQNTPVWNTLIWECMKAKRFKLAYQLFIDMKRRGFSPTTRTFQTMFSGLSRIEHWPTHPKQLTNAHSIYESFQRHMTSVKKDDSNSPELSIDPLALYIKLLGDAGQHQEIFDVYYAMDTEGPLSPNQFIFTAMFKALSTKKEVYSSSQNSTIEQKNAADARLLWSQMQKASKKAPGFQIDSFIVTSAITALSRGRPADQDFAFQIARDYFGLTAPGEPPSTGIIPLGAQSFAAILKLCNSGRKPSMCSHFLQQVKKRPEASGGVSILDRAHLEEVLKARLSLSTPGSGPESLDLLEWMLRQEITGTNGPKIRPSISTYNLVLTACWKDKDWASATRTFDLMTGYHSHDFMDGAVSGQPRFSKRAAGRNLMPTAEAMSSLMRTALATKDLANMRQCLRIVDHLGVDQSFAQSSETEISNKIAKNKAFYISKLASALAESVAYVLDGHGKGHTSQEEARRWRALGNQAKGVLRTDSNSDLIPTIDEK